MTTFLTLPSALYILASCMLASSRAAEPAAPPPREVLDVSLAPPIVITAPGPEFQDEARPGAMILGMDRTPKGRIWACWTGTGDKPDTYFILATSDDDGRTWSKPRLVVGAPDPQGNPQRRALVGNVWTDPGGRVWLFFDQSLGGFDGRAGDWHIRCDNPDAAEPAWSKPVRIADGCTLNKPTVLASGDWLLPVSLWTRDRINPAVFREAHHDLDPIRMANVFASTDQGKTWTRRGGVAFPQTDFDEHTIVELRDGRLWMLARTKYGIAESFSSDAGRTWTEPKPSAIENVSARFFIRRLASGRLLLVKNGPIDRRLPKRSHLSAFLSDDDGKTWRGGLLLDERSSVSYPDGFQAPDGLVHVLYDWNRHTDAEILMAKFREEDVLAGQFQSPGAAPRILVNKATGPKPDRLYNGIELPSEWPSRHGDPQSTEPMPVPYLERPPKVIPVDVGRQLFVDDFLVERTDLKRTFHLAQKHPANPVLKAETQYELAPSAWNERGQEAVCFLGHGGVFFDPRDGIFKMFYTAGWRGGLALATSRDLLRWTRPDLGLSGGNLLLAPGKDVAGADNCVWLDINTRRPEERIKFLTLRGSHVLLTSGDGRQWSEPVPTGKAADYCSFFFNPFRNVWVFSVKQLSPRGRCRYYAENADFLRGADWSKAVYWTNADRLDEPEPAIGNPPQLYSLNAVAYESLLLGEFYIHRGPANRVCEEGKFPKLIDLCLGFSRDGFHWHRPDRRPFLAATRREGDWDRGYLHGTAGVCLVMDDKLWFPYTGCSGVAPNGTRGMYCGESIGMATLRRDGFASMDAGDKPGKLTTRPIVFQGRYLYVNLDAPRGELRAEVLDRDGNPIAPFTAENCVPLHCDHTRQRVTWRGADNLARLGGKPVRLRFRLTSGSLYSFWISPDANGASYGFVAAGGPGFPGTTDTTGN